MSDGAAVWYELDFPYVDTVNVEDWLQGERRFLEWKAHGLAPRDPMLAEDLVQEAMIALWNVDPSRFARHEHGFIRKAMVHAMYDAWEREWHQRPYRQATQALVPDAVTDEERILPSDLLDPEPYRRKECQGRVRGSAGRRGSCPGED